MVWRAMHSALASRIYTNGAQQSASGAVFPDAPSSIPNIGAEFLGFTSKSVEVWPNLPGPDERCCREGGRLAVDQTWQGKGLGAAILRDASLTTLQAAEIAGIRAILVHALHERAAAFYRHAGFSPSPVSDTTLMLALKDARAARTNS